MLAADACVSPRGDLVVAVHSGVPDWGSGPKGKGKLYKISNTATATCRSRCSPGPRRRRRCASRSTGRSIRPSLRDLAGEDLDRVRPSVQPGRSVRVAASGLRGRWGGRWRTPRFELPILSAQVSADRRTLSLLLTTPHPEAVLIRHHAPGDEVGRLIAWPGRGELPQVADVDLGYDLSGVEATWRPEAGGGGWSGWLPHLDLAVARAFTAGSADHDRLWEAIKRPGRLTLKTKLDLWQMLRPAVQPGSTTGYTPAGRRGVARSRRAGTDRSGQRQPGALPRRRARTAGTAIRIVVTPKERAAGAGRDLAGDRWVDGPRRELVRPRKTIGRGRCPCDASCCPGHLSKYGRETIADA